MTTFDDRLAANPFTKHGLDAAYLRQIEHHIGHMLRTPGYWPSPTEQDAGSVWVALVPRPTRDGAFTGEELSRRQQEWDAAADRFKVLLAANVESRQRRATKAAEQERVRQQDIASIEQRRLEALTERLRRGYFQVPGATNADFQRDLPDLLAEERRRAALRGSRDATSPLTLAEIMNPGDLDAA